MAIISKNPSNFSTLPAELHEHILDFAIEGSINRKPTYEVTYFGHNFEAAHRVRTNFLTLASVNRQFRSSLTPALQGTKKWLAAMESTSINELMDCVPLPGEKTPVDSEIYEAIVSHLRSAYVLRGTSEDCALLLEKILANIKEPELTIFPGILVRLWETRGIMGLPPSPFLSDVINLISKSHQNNSDVLGRFAIHLTSIEYNDQEPHWSNFLPIICKYDKENETYLSQEMLRYFFKVPPDRQYERLEKLLDEKFEDPREITSEWAEIVESCVLKLSADDQSKFCRRYFDLSAEEWRQKSGVEDT